MPVIISVLRYFPLGAIAGPAAPITKPELDVIARKYNVIITLSEVKGKTARVDGINIREETMNSTIEEVTQSAITITSDNEAAVKKAIKDIIKKYRAPRTVFGSWGSNEQGKRIISEICDIDDGWR